MIGFVLGMLAAQTIAAAPSSPTTVSFLQVLETCKKVGLSSCKGDWRGLAYEINSDQSDVLLKTGMGVEWMMSCRVDEIDDSRSCRLLSSTRRGRPYFLALWGNEFKGVAVTVANLGDAYPGERDSLRVDQNLPFTVKNDGVFSIAISLAIINQMRAGRVLRMRYVSWPEEYQEDDTVDLSGFAAVYEAALEIRRYNGL